MSVEREVFNRAVSQQEVLNDIKRLDKLIELYPWFDMLRMLKFKALDEKKADKYRKEIALNLFSNNYYNLLHNKSYADYTDSQAYLKKKQFYNAAKTSSGESSSLIDSFLSIDLSKRKVEDVDNKYVNVDLSGGHDDSLVSEDIAAVYVKLGDFQEAEKIYCQLSLKYPEKSAYFAKVLQELKNNNKL